MSWTKTVVNNAGDVLLSETIAGPNGAETVYSSDFADFVKGNLPNGTKYVSLFVIKATGTLQGTSIDLGVHGSNDGGTTKFVLKDAPGSIADLNATTVVSAGSAFDIAPYPARARYIGITGDGGADDSDCTLTIYIYIPKV